MLKKRQKVGYTVIDLEHPYTIGEDFSGLLEHHPGVFAFIGSNSEYDLHHPKYNPDERILEKTRLFYRTDLSIISIIFIRKFWNYDLITI